jgi:alanyl-tRNA synthetase
MRFDFAHPQKMTPEQVRAAEDLVNAAIKRDYQVTWQEMSFADAKKMGAIGLFEDKYEAQIKVYTVGDTTLPATANPTDPTFSREVCGGPHVEHTGTIGTFKIVKEEAVSAGVRRIKAIIE